MTQQSKIIAITVLLFGITACSSGSKSTQATSEPQALDQSLVDLENSEPKPIEDEIAPEKPIKNKLKASQKKKKKKSKTKSRS
jgi:hypothetical protein